MMKPITHRIAKQILLLKVFYLFSIILPAQCPNLVWADEFNGTSLDLTKWTPQIGDGCDINLCGWGNNELEYYRAENATVAGGTLKIIAKRETFGNRNYTSARLRTINKGDWTYGRFEARMKLPTAQGMWPAFWMLSTDDTYGGWPRSGEMDIMELVGKEPDRAHGTIHYGNAFPNNSSKTASYQLNSGIFSDAFHTFAMEWEPGVIRWYVDDFLYSTKTTGDVIPLTWPFNRRFHLLLNLAVGGNWPGSPNGSTAFPQTMEVDYVRVYEGKFPHITGKRKVANQAQNEIYMLNNVPAGSTVTWIAPMGATIAAGQGTSSITVNWGGTPGDLVATISNGCYNRQITLNVSVEAVLARELSFKNFDQAPLITFISASGTLTDNVANPAPNTINGSALCGRYVRNGSQQYDVLQYSTAAITNASVYYTGQKKFYIDIYTNAPPNTLILLQLENSNSALPANYPTGRHSRYQASTIKQNEWQRLVFEPLDQPDASTSNSGVNRIVFLFASNSFSNNTFHWDNFDGYAAATTPTTTAFVGKQFRVFPNPASDVITIVNEFSKSITNIIIYDINGKEVLRRNERIEPNESFDLQMNGLQKGVYYLRAVNIAGQIESQRIVKL